MSNCKAPDCTKPVYLDGLCGTHRSRRSRYGSYDLPARPSLQEVFWASVEKTPTCWLWTGTLTTDGYARLPAGRRGTYIRGHRYAYELMVGPLSDDLVVDHVCHNRDGWCPGNLECAHRRCVNPDHLEAVTHGVNTSRAALSRAACKHGHPRTPDNFLVYAGKRYCKRCTRDRSRLDWLREKGVSIPPDLHYLLPPGAGGARGGTAMTYDAHDRYIREAAANAPDRFWCRGCGVHRTTSPAVLCPCCSEGE